MGSRTPGNAGTRTRSFPFRRAGHNPPGRFPTQRSDLGVLGYIIVYLETNILLDHYRFFFLYRDLSTRIGHAQHACRQRIPDERGRGYRF